MVNINLVIGVLAFHGDVIEHIQATESAARSLSLQLKIIEVRTKTHLDSIDALIIPGGESTTLYKLCEREGMWEKMKKIRYIFGTCAGAIMLSKAVLSKAQDQKTLELMDITIDRNAYGRQTESFERKVKTEIGEINAVFIRAPKIKQVTNSAKVLAKDGDEIVACEQYVENNYYLATCFHPELTTPKFHEYFLDKIINLNCLSEKLLTQLD